LIGAAIGCLLVSRVSVARTPPPGDAARLVLHDPPPQPPVLPRRPRTRRAVVVDPADPAPLRAESAADFLALVPLFAGLEASQRGAIAARTRSVRLEAGRWLFREGDTGDAMYIVRAGRLRVIDEHSASTVRELGRGDWVGELAMLTGSPRSASVRAERASDLLAVERRDFEQLLQDSPPLSLALASALAQQLRDTRAAMPNARPLATAVAVVTLDDRVPLAELAHRLAAELKDHRSVAVLDGREASAPDLRHAPATVYGPLLDRAEAGHDLVLLSAGVALSGEPWTEFCLQQADRILAVTAGGAVPPGLPDRPELNGCDLVGYDVSPGSGALAGWVTALEPIESHGVRADQLEADLGRLARRLSGRSVGIVLSGGGARAFAHIGVLEELTAAGVVIDRVAGMSMGAFIGGLFAMGLDGEEMDRRCFEEWVQRRPLRDYTLPRQGLIRGARVVAMLQRTFGTVAIEELARSFICGATDLRSGELVLSRYGLLYEAVGLSINIPILAPPRVHAGNVLIDGSLTDNLPVQPMAELGEGPIIAVDVKMTFNPEGDGHRATPAAERPARVPSLGETLTRVLLLGSANTSDAARRYADVVIRPRTGSIGLLEFHQLDAAREAGRVATSEMLEASAAHLFARP
jgi:NTE family protein